MNHQPDLKRVKDLCNLTDDEWSAIFFLVSKGEHDNEAWDKTFTSAHGGSVFTYADALKYDWKQRGVTCGIVGFTTANDGKPEWGDAQPMLKKFHKLGGPDLTPLAKDAHKNKEHAETLCKKIGQLEGADYDTFVDAQMAMLCEKGGYLYETVHVLIAADIPRTPLFIAALFDTALNFGLGGKYCPVHWMKEHACKGNSARTLRAFLKFKAESGARNHHNSCKHNAEGRADQFLKLMQKGDWNLSRSGCESVVAWTMK